MKPSKLLLSLLICFSLVLSFYAIGFSVEVEAAGTTYYVDSVSGNDGNNGTSANRAWKTLSKVNSTTFSAGSTILFKRGGSWTGILAPKGSGNSSNYNTISCYGDENDNLPIISNSNEKYNSKINTTVILHNQSYWNVTNLEVVNTCDTTEKYGIYVMSDGGVRINNVTVSDCVVHGAVNTFCKTTVKGTGLTGIMVSHGGSYYGYQDNITVENNTIYDCNGSGIVSTGSAGCGPNGTVDNNANKKNVIRGNYLRNIGQEGILVTNNNAPLVEYNVVDTSHSSTTTTWHVAIWAFSSYNALFQYNEAYNTKTTYDGHAFDCDYQCYGTTFQYNYGHDNEGGFMLICCEPTNWDGGFSFNNNCTIRYNIAQNNPTVQFALTGQIDNTKIYNNTLYYKSGDSVSTYIRTVNKNPEKGPNNTQFYNNIFYNVNGGKFSFSYTESGVTGYAKNTVWQNNLFYGKHPSSEPSDSGKITSDPKFIEAGGAKTGLDSCQVYYLKKGSPALGAGIPVENTCAYPCTTDFFGNPIKARPNIGAYDGDGYDGVETTTGEYTEAPTTPPKTEVDGDNSIYQEPVCVWNKNSWCTKDGDGATKTFDNGYMNIDANSSVSVNMFQLGTWNGGGFFDSDIQRCVGKKGMAIKVKIDRAYGERTNPQKLDVVLKLSISGIGVYSLGFDGITVGGGYVAAYFPYEDFTYVDDRSVHLQPEQAGSISGFEFDIVSYESFSSANFNSLKASISPIYVYDENTPAQILGDVNNDGNVNSVDMLIMRRHILTIPEQTDVFVKEFADMNSDSNINSLDILLLKRKILGI